MTVETILSRLLISEIGVAICFFQLIPIIGLTLSLRIPRDQRHLFHASIGMA